MKLESTERFLSGLEKGQPASQRASTGPADLTQEQQQREEVGVAWVTQPTELRTWGRNKGEGGQ